MTRKQFLKLFRKHIKACAKCNFWDLEKILYHLSPPYPVCAFYCAFSYCRMKKTPNFKKASDYFSDYKFDNLARQMVRIVKELKMPPPKEERK